MELITCDILLAADQELDRTSLSEDLNWYHMLVLSQLLRKEEGSLTIHPQTWIQTKSHDSRNQKEGRWKNY